MNQQSKNIIEALHSASSGRIVYEALTQVPTDNLLHMHDMIAYILTSREDAKTCS